MAEEIHGLPEREPDQGQDDTASARSGAPLKSESTGMPHMGFRGIVSRAGCEYRVTVAAEMDFYPKHQPWVFVTPTILGARENGKLSVDVVWSSEISRFADVIRAVVAHVENVSRIASQLP